MVDPETNTTPISCGNAASDDSHASPTPTKLTAGDFFQHDDALEVDTEAGLSPSKTFPSTPSSSPYSDARDRGGGNDHVIQDRPGAVAVGTATVNHSMAATMLGLKLDGHETELHMPRLVFGCLFSYLVLGLWIYTITLVLVMIQRRNCTEVYADLKEGTTDPYERSCVDLFTGKLACAHSITFGLISAVVIHETSSSDSAQHRLSSIVKPILNRCNDKANCCQKALYSVTVWLPAVYVVSWAIGGLLCFLYSVTAPDGSSGPLFYTGQTWLGIIIRASYSFFGVREKTCECNSNESSQSYSHRAQQDMDVETGLAY